MKVKVSAVSYLNTLPFLFGLKHSELQNELDLALDIPSDCAKKLLNNEVDLGLVPVAIIPELKEYHIISDYCIGANGKVDTVALFSEVPLNQIENIYLDFHSKTSITLVKLLAKHYWKINPSWLPAELGFESKISDTTAAVVIGDRTFNITKKYKYDLAEAWKEYTGMPFVFACWVSNKKLSDELVESFNKALSFGINHIDSILSEYVGDINKTILGDYLTNKIDYVLDSKKKEALNHFLKLLA